MLSSQLVRGEVADGKLCGIFVPVTKKERKLYLSEWRAYRNMTQEQLEAESGVSQTTIWDIEDKPTKRRHPGTLANLAKALGTTPSKLYTDPFEESGRVSEETLQTWGKQEWTKELIRQGITELHAKGVLTERDLFDMLMDLAKKGVIDWPKET